VVPFQEAPSPPMTPALREACKRALHAVTSSGEILKAGLATLFVLEQLGYRRLAQALRLPPLIWLVELGYRVVASNRSFFARFLFRSTPGR
jgi:predicted DCC family thiol-disulfide oxidoreductase YuxK